MMFMIIFVLHDPELLQDVLNAWDEAGAKGVTILPSTGLKRLLSQDTLREDMPLIPSIDDLLQTEERLNRTLFTIVDDEPMIDKIVEATQSVTCDLDLPNTGILTVLPVVRAYGLNRKEDGECA
jgi:nitrogen regulatory protein PII